MPGPREWTLRETALSLAEPRLMAIINLTPDSFHAPSRASDVAAALDAAERAVQAGACILDLGAESTRPGASPVSEQDQVARLVPVVRAVRRAPGDLGRVPLSVDTTLSGVARACLDAGASAINDVSAGTDDPGMFALAAGSGCGLVLMHRLRAPSADRYSDAYASPPVYGDVVEEVRAYLAERARSAMQAGVAPGAIMLDPGLGFGKSVEDNVRLVRGVGRLGELGFAVLGALSRKSFVGRVSLGRDSRPEERLAGTLAMNLELVRNGVRLLRVHDVGAHAEALRAWGVLEGGPPSGVRGE